MSCYPSFNSGATIDTSSSSVYAPASNRSQPLSCIPATRHRSRAWSAPPRPTLLFRILVGPEAKIRSVVQSRSLDITPYEIVSTEHNHAAAAKAVALARTGKVEALMKGSLHTDELTHEVTATETGLRTARRISHAFVMDVPRYTDPLLITDAAINIFPDLEEMRDICQNAIDVARVLLFKEAKVAILSAVETVTEKMPSTMVVAALCRWLIAAKLPAPSSMDHWRSTTQ